MKRILYLIVCMTALLTGCTDEMDTMQGGISEVTLTLATDAQYANDTEPMAKTRAAVTMNRYVMEIYTDEACTEQANVFDNGTTHRKQQTTADFSLTLDRSKTYYCLFWADEGTSPAYTVSKLQNVSFNMYFAKAYDAPMAYAGKAVIDGAHDGISTVTLRRAVAQVVLNDIAGMEPGQELTLDYFQPNVFNVATGSVSGSYERNPTVTIKAGAGPYRFCMLAPRNEPTHFKLNYKYAAQNYQAIDNIPTQANYITNVTGHFRFMPDEMKFTIDLTSFPDKSYTLPFTASVTDDYTLTVDWGDGTVVPIPAGTAPGAAVLKHTYPNQQSYQITISSTPKSLTQKKQIPDFKPGRDLPNDNRLKIISMDSPILCTGGISLDVCFANCSNLKTIPSALFEKNTQVTNMGSCFMNCTGLTEIPPTLFAKNVAVREFGSCFYGCTGLTGIPDELFRTNTAATSFKNCFNGCTNLSAVPAKIFGQNTNVTDFSFCFNKCTGLRILPGTLFQTNTEVTNFSQCFRGCSSLTELPGDLFKGNTKVTDFSSCFYECTGLTELPIGLFAQNAKVTTFKQCFYICTSLKTIPTGLFAGNPAVTDFTSCFVGCTVLEAIPASMFDNNTKVTTFGSCFRSCGNLEAIPSELFAKNTAATNFNQCFQNCTKAGLNANIFCDESTAKTTRFANTSAAVNFYYCFYNCGGNGAIPALWEYTYNQTPTKTKCFGGVSNATNKNDIDSEWK